eukprot:scaffold2119_cov264-Pinguiococcus_pyrenoidosus.AAC.13
MNANASASGSAGLTPDRSRSVAWTVVFNVQTKQTHLCFSDKAGYRLRLINRGKELVSGEYCEQRTA